MNPKKIAIVVGRMTVFVRVVAIPKVALVPLMVLMMITIVSAYCHSCYKKLSVKYLVSFCLVDCLFSHLARL